MLEFCDWVSKIALESFNLVVGNDILNKITLADLENCQARRKKEGRADNTIGREIGAAMTMVFTGLN